MIFLNFKWSKFMFVQVSSQSQGNDTIPIFTITDHLFARAYYCICTATDLIQLVTKVALGIITTTFAGLLFGQSNLINRCVQYAWEDVAFSAQMTAQSLRGIVDPIGAYVAKAYLHKENLSHGFGKADLHLVLNMNAIENIVIRFVLVANMVKEIVQATLACVRGVSSGTMYVASCGTAPSVGLLTLGAVGSFWRSAFVAGICFTGIFMPSVALKA